VDRSIWCWGSNWDGALGTGAAEPSRGTATPVRIVGSGDWSSVAAAAWNSCGLRTDHSLWCWGNNRSGQLATGEGEESLHFSPVNAIGGTAWSTISQEHADHGCGIKRDTTLWCWGLNQLGQLGIGESGWEVYEATPVRVTG
jgi:alpha-tubulin suppressor-like RCC1 family protein